MRQSLRLATLSALLLASSAAHATRCPTVMVVLDRSGSMALNPSNGSTPPSKIDIAKMALTTLITDEGATLPFGLTTFSNSGSCSTGIDVLVDVMDGTQAAILSALAPITPLSDTNTGPAIDTVSQLPSMHDTTRPGSYIVLVTDGEPDCPGNIAPTDPDPKYTVDAIGRAAALGIKTFVVGFGSLPTADMNAMNMMAAAGGEPCMGGTCNGQQFYAAEDQAGLQAAITAISTVITGELGGACDDTCYGSGCPDAGQICVNAMCVTNPCTSVASTCAPGDYCFTDGTSAGTCATECPSTCPEGQSCTTSGCKVDPCSTVTCDLGATCQNGSCVPTPCATPCLPQQKCVAGVCKDDPCRYISCPSGGSCTLFSGTCSAPVSTSGGTGGNHARRARGCELTTHSEAGSFGALLAFALLFARRRKRAT